jgi:hypothetical protein
MSDFVTARFDDGLKTYLDRIDPKNVPKLTSRTMRRTIDTVKTEASSTIRDDYNIKKADLDPNMKVKYANPGDLKAVITVSGKPITLLYFGAKQLTAQNQVISRTGGKQLKRASRTLQQGVTFEILKGQKKTLKNAFISFDPRLNRLVIWRRVGSHRYPVKSINMVTIASLFANKKTLAAMLKKVKDEGQKIAAQEFNFMMNGRKSPVGD